MNHRAVVALLVVMVVAALLEVAAVEVVAVAEVVAALLEVAAAEVVAEVVAVVVAVVEVVAVVVAVAVAVAVVTEVVAVAVGTFFFGETIFVVVVSKHQFHGTASLPAPRSEEGIQPVSFLT